MEARFVGTLLLLWISIPPPVPADAIDATRIVEVRTGKPRVDTRGGSPTRLGDRQDYGLRTENEELAVPPERDPWAALADTRYGLLGHDRYRRITFAVREGERGRRQVLVDTNRDGDLRDERVVKTREVEQGQRVLVELRDPPVKLALQFYDAAGEHVPSLVVMSDTFREGVARLDGRRVRCAVQGSYGTYGAEWQEVFFDTDGDGKIDRSRFSDERYVTQAAYVNLGGRSWAFSVSADGGRVTFEPLADRRPDRVRLGPGNPAPDFAFTDLDGRAGRLSDYRGQVVLLYLWATWCGPCKGETPHLIEAYERFHDRGFEILAVAKNDTPEAVRAYVEESGSGWRQTLDEEDGPIAGLYRADSIPNALIIDRDGVIVERSIRGARVVERLETLLTEAAVD